MAEGTMPGSIMSLSCQREIEISMAVLDVCLGGVVAAIALTTRSAEAIVEPMRN